MFQSSIGFTTLFFGNYGKRIAPLAALISGFLVLLILMVILAFDSARSLRELQARDSQALQDFLARERSLRIIRATIDEAANLLREYALSDLSPKTVQSYATRLEDMSGHAQAAMESCFLQSPPNVQEAMRKLAAETERYWLAANHTLSDGTHKGNPASLPRAALDQRAAVVAVTGEISRVNELQLRLAELENASAFAKSRSRLQSFFALAIGISVILAITSFIYVFRLENCAEEKCLESLHCQGELKKLSKCLVDALDALENERRDVSRELHDEIAKILGALLIHVQDLLDDPHVAFGSSRMGLQKIRRLTEDAFRKVCNTARRLRPCLSQTHLEADTSGGDAVKLPKQR